MAAISPVLRMSQRAVNDQKTTIVSFSLLAYITFYLIVGLAGVGFPLQPTAAASYYYAPFNFSNPAPDGGIHINVPNIVLGVNITDTDDASDITTDFYLDSSLNGTKTVQSGHWANLTVNGTTEGDHSWYVNASDGVNFNRSGTWTFTIDTTAPHLRIHAPRNDSLDDATPFLNVTANEPATAWQYAVDGDSNTSFTPNISLPAPGEGTHTVQVWANDTAGNQNTSSRTFTVDTNSAPNPPQDPSPFDQAALGNGTVDLSVLYDDPDGDDGTVFFYNATDDIEIGQCPVSAGARCGITWDGRSGSQHWYAVAEDVTGERTQSETWNFTVDTTLTGGGRIAIPPGMKSLTVGLGATIFGQLRVYNPLTETDIYEITVTSSNPAVTASIESNVERINDGERVLVTVGPGDTRTLRVRYTGARCSPGSQCTSTITFRGRSLETDQRFATTATVTVNRDQSTHSAAGISLLEVLVIGVVAGAILFRFRR